MERKILFKAKKLSDGKWVKGDLLHKGNKTYIYSPHINDKGFYVENEEVDPFTVCQFTGLKDEDGKDVWEHDILNIVMNTVEYEVVSLYGAWQLINSIERMPINDLKITINDYLVCWKVVGNKFDRKVRNDK